MKVAIYTRVSKEELNPKNQEIVLKDFCKKRGYTIYGIYEDEISGAKLERPALKQLMEDAKQKKFDAVVFWSIDRLARSVLDLWRIADFFRQQGIQLICVSQDIDTTTPTGKFLFTILGAVAEFEKDIISQRTKLGILRAKKEGKKIGRPPKKEV